MGVYSGTDGRFRWNIVEYSAGRYVIVNSAHGTVLTIASDGELHSAFGYQDSGSHWRLIDKDDYVPRTTMSMENMVLEMDDTVSYSSLRPMVNGTVSLSSPASFATDLTSYTLTEYGPAATMYTDYFKVTTYGSSTFTLSCKDTTATCTFKVMVNPTDGTYFIRNVKSGMYMQTVNDAIPEGMQIVQRSFAGADSQKWILELQNNGYFMIKNAHSGLYIGIESNSSAQNANAKQYAENTQSTGQLFKIEITTSGYIKITPKSGENVNRVLALDGTSDTTPYDAKVQQRNFVDDTNRKDEWQLIPENDQASDTATLIPQHFRSLIQDDLANANDLYFTSDGFYMINKSLAEILGAKGITYLPENSDATEQREVSLYYDDWYVFGVRQGTQVTYGLCKMREQEFDNKDSDDPGVTISFIGLNISILARCLNDDSTANRYALLQVLEPVTGPGSFEDDDNITSYFSNTSSIGAYLIAERYISFLVNSISGNTIDAPNNLLSIFDQIEEIDAILEGNLLLDPELRISLLQRKADLQRVPDALESINAASGRNIFSFNDNTITIQNKNELTLFERQTILACFTADVTFNSFVAEVEFHADAVNSWVSSVPWVGNKWYEAAVRADMAIGEEYESGFYDEYYDLNSSIVVAQTNAHGGY